MSENINRTYGKITSIIGLIILAFSLNAAQTAMPKSYVINSLKEDAAWVLKEKTLEEMLAQPGGVSDRDVQSMKTVKERAEKALQKIKQLTDGGMAETEKIQIEDVTMTLGEMSEQIFAMHRDAEKVLVMQEMYQGGIGTKSFVEDIAGGKMKDSDAYGDPLEAAKIHSDRLLKAVKEAQKLGFPDDFKLPIYEQTYTLAELKEMALYVSVNAQKQKDAIVAARNAKDTPFLNVLTGDKARIFKDEFGGLGGEWLCMGSGGAALTTPAQMKAATVWFTYGSSSGLIDTWHITGYRFSGDKLVGRISRSGYGLKPPGASFR